MKKYRGTTWGRCGHNSVLSPGNHGVFSSHRRAASNGCVFTRGPGVFFFCSWTTRKDWGGPPSVYHFISEREQIRLYLCGCTAACVDAIVAHFFLDAGFCVSSLV